MNYKETGENIFVDFIFIDWISPPDHALFNRSFISSLNIENNDFYIFSDKLKLDGLNNILLKEENRFRRFIKILYICLKNRKKKIFFLTYEKPFIPVLSIFCRNIFVFEHNTTPESLSLSLNTIWQKYLFRKILRLTQYPMQFEVLKKLKQKTHFLGSPLNYNEETKLQDKDNTFLVPGTRLSVSEIFKIEHLLANVTLLIKTNSFSDKEVETLNRKFKTNLVNRIDFDNDLKSVKGIIITSKSRIRGSGWFNDAIKFGIPLVITDNDTKVLFTETFPNYPFIDPKELTSISDFELKLENIRNYDRLKYVENYASSMKNKMHQILQET